MRDIKTVSDFLKYRCEKDPKATSVGKVVREDVVSLDYEQYRDKIFTLALSLKNQGIKKGDYIAIWGETSLEWHLIDMACMLLGCISVPIYPTTSRDQILFILNQTQAKALFVDNYRLIAPIKEDLEKISTKSLFFFQRPNQEQLESLDSETYLIQPFSVLEREHHGSIEDIPESLPEIYPQDVATVVYTSGTTGKPKGAVITHEGLVQQLKNLYSNFQGSITSTDKSLCFLPLSHVLGRCDSLLHLPFGIQVYFSEGIDRILKNLETVQPTLMIAVPRVFEKIYQLAIQQIQKEGIIQQNIFSWAESISNEYFERLDQDLAPSTKQLIGRQLAYRLVYSKIYQRFGGKIRFFVSGGAPLSLQVIQFMRNANLTILEGYGLTETLGPCAVSPIRKQIPGAVGLPIGDVKINLAEDGEILIQTKAMFTHYLDAPDETAKSLQNGWFYTGDIGVILPEGFLKITDRKKDIIITSTGKNIAPQKIENMMTTQQHISNFMVVGDRRKFLAAVVGIDKQDFVSYFEDWGVDPTIEPDQLSKLPEVIQIIESEIESVNAKLSRHETIRKFIVAPFPLTIESGHITPSFKLKRKSLETQLKREIDAMYNSEAL